MGVADFVDENRKMFWRTRQEELAPLMDPATGLIKRELLRSADCCVCAPAKPTAAPAFTKSGFNFVKCDHCGLLYVSEQLREDLLEKLYYESRSMDYWMKVQLGEKEQAWNIKSKFGPGLDTLDELLPAKGLLLDIGCSVGQFMVLAAERGWQVKGIELNQVAKEYCRNTLGLDVADRLLEDISYPENSFDCITLWGVLEHLAQPDAILQEIHRILKPGGMVLCFVPNAHSLIIRMTQEKNSTVSGREHLWYFSPATIEQAYRKNGFKTAKIITVLPQLHEIVHYLRYNTMYQESTYAGEEEFDIPEHLAEPLADYLLGNHMGYKMIAVGAKE